MTRLIVGPFNRVEGDLEVKLDIGDGVVDRAYVNSPLYRGFERMLLGKEPADALVVTPRICGICSVSQSMAAAEALCEAQQLTVPHNGRLTNNIVHAVENLADHLSHFYLFFMPDFARAIYSDEPWYADTQERFRAVKGSASADMLPARAEILNLMGILAGKWPHTLSLRAGGTTRSVTASEVTRMTALLTSFKRFLERFLFGDRLDNVLAISSIADLERWAEGTRQSRSDFGQFLRISADLKLQYLGRATDRFMSFGAYNFADRHHFARGLYEGGQVHAVVPSLIAEDLSHAWYANAPMPQDPASGETIPDVDVPDAYSWCKAPRLGGEVVEVGAIARQVVNGHPLISDLVSAHGGNVHTRVVARVLEIALLVDAIGDWIAQIVPSDPFCVQGPIPDEADAVGMTEAARGALGHWLSIRKGRIANYQIIAPTTWNFSPRDSEGQPGALEQALTGAPVREGETDPVSVQHIVRSFDPCMVCTVH